MSGQAEVANGPAFADGAALEEAAAGVERAAVEAVNKKENRSLYQKRTPVHPKRVRGTFRRLKWIIMAVTLGIYYLTPWIRWDRGANAPDQAVLLDFPNRKFYFFFIEIWPQEIYLVTGLLVLAALALFLVTSIAGRVWCGYFCPQTVWTDLFIAVERWVDGERNARIRLEKAPWTATKVRKRVIKHGIWLVIAMATGGAWVFYFRDAPTLAVELAVGDAPMIAYLFIGIFTFTTYSLGGLMREQVCIYMCPWPRIQGALFDEESLLVSYRSHRGEPRGTHKKGNSWDGRGDCIDCKQCVVSCPTGIDIRDGPQLECIQCALCVDACNAIMAKVGRPPNLIAYDTVRNLEAADPASRARPRIVRPRTLVYAGLMVLVAAIMLIALVSREQMNLNVLQDRNPFFVVLKDGLIRNTYTLKITNRAHKEKLFTVTVDGLANAEARILGIDGLELKVPADEIVARRLFITAAPTATPVVAITIRVDDPATGNSVQYETSFRGPDG